ncbi:MAG: MarR family transcriptional regulator [Actinobacteria bacterium]|nr:MarR family transcriptional regulator [Actinomycetota bacterium]
MPTPRPIGFWLKLVDRMIDEQFASTLDEHGVTRRQWQLLNVLQQEPATEEQLDAAVAPFLSEEQDETSAEHLAELVDSGWVQLVASRYELLERGRTALERLSGVVAAQRTLITDGLTQQQYDDTLAVLERMARNLGWRD